MTTPRPARIQRSRAKGSRLPDGAICVTRPGRFGNPYPHDGTPEGRAQAVASFAHHLATSGGADTYPSDADIRTALAGHDLACWCPPGPCHADTLIDLAGDLHLDTNGKA